MHVLNLLYWHRQQIIQSSGVSGQLAGSTATELPCFPGRTASPPIRDLSLALDDTMLRTQYIDNRTISLHTYTKQNPTVTEN